MSLDPWQVFLAPVVATVITTGAVAGREWVRGRQKEAQGLRNLDLATRKLAYFDAWFTVYERVNGGQPIPELRALVEPELQSARQLAQHGWVDAQRAPRWTFRGVKNYVLLTNVKGPFGVRVLRFCYWISLLYLLFVAPIWALTIFVPPDNEKAEAVGGRLVGALLAFFILGMGPVVILRALTKWRGRVAIRRGAIPDPAASPDPDAEPGGSSPPAGWYSDPQSPALRRYWDGTGWTEHSAP
jgi:hypothetical protein